MFTQEDIICAYTRRQALEDGEQVDANTGELAEISRQHCKYPVYMTRSVWDLIEQAVNDPQHGNDLRGIWHDILWMTGHGQALDAATRQFDVIITGAGSCRLHTLIAQCGPTDIDDARPCITIMHPEEL